MIMSVQTVQSRRIAGSLGCGQLSSEWVSIVETPTHTTRQDREYLNSVNVSEG
jgi:hypothetical protein